MGRTTKATKIWGSASLGRPMLVPIAEQERPDILNQRRPSSTSSNAVAYSLSVSTFRTIRSAACVRPSTSISDLAVGVLTV